MFQFIRSVRVEYVVRVSSVTSLYIGHWKVFDNISLADRQTDIYLTKQTQFYKLRIVKSGIIDLPPLLPLNVSSVFLEYWCINDPFI